MLHALLCLNLQHRFPLFSVALVFLALAKDRLSSMTSSVGCREICDKGICVESLTRAELSGTVTYTTHSVIATWITILLCVQHKIDLRAS